MNLLKSTAFPSHEDGTIVIKKKKKKETKGISKSVYLVHAGAAAWNIWKRAGSKN